MITSMLGLSALGLNVVLNIALLPQIGILGASIASSACYVALALSYVVISRRQGVAGWKTWSRGPRIWPYWVESACGAS